MAVENQDRRQEMVQARLRTEVPESLGPAGIRVVPAVTRRRRCTRPRRRGSGCDEADGRSGRDRAAGTPTVCGADKAAGANADPDARTNTRRPDHGGAPYGSHAAMRTASNGTATPDDDHLLYIGGSKNLEFCAWHWTAQRLSRWAERHCGQR